MTEQQDNIINSLIVYAFARFFVMCAVILMLSFSVAVASGNNSSSSNNNTAPPPATGKLCTDQPFYNRLDKGGEDVLNALMKTISEVLESSSEGLYNYIVNNSEYIDIIAGLLTLYILVYGVMIMYGMAPFTGAEVVLRLVKIGVLLALVSPTGWNFFNQHVRLLFTGGMNELIVMFNNITTGRNTPIPAPGNNVSATIVLAAPIKMLLSSRLHLTILAILFTGPYGLVYGILILWALTTLVYTIVAALGTYIKALIGLYFLFALAPIFFIFMLFKNTRHIFDGWISQMVGFVLQPIFIFAFLGLFMELILATVGSITKVPVCYTKIKLVDYADISYHWWRFEIVRPMLHNVLNLGSVSIPVVTMEYEMYEGPWGFCGPSLFCSGKIGCKTCIHPIFPVDIMDVILLIFVTQLAFNYTKFVEQIATEVAGASASVSVGAQSVRNWLLSKGISPGQIAGGTARGGGRAAMKAINLLTGRRR